MIVVLNARLARRVAAVSTVASTDDERPALQSVCIDWTPEGSGGEPSVTFVSTDSYRLIAYEVDGRFHAREVAAFGRVGEVEGDGRTIVEAKAFAKALEKAASHATVKSDSSAVVLMAEADSPLAIYAYHPDKGEVEIAKLEPTDRPFPNWQKLVSGDTVLDRVAAETVTEAVTDGLERAGLESEHEAIADQVVTSLERRDLAVVPNDQLTRASAYNPGYLAELLAAYRAGNHPLSEQPVKVEVHGPRPTMLRSTRAEDGWLGLLMPVRL